jgi:hypothetical protein
MEYDNDVEYIPYIEDTNDNTNLGYLYIMYNERYGNNILKIGSTKNPIGRYTNYITYLDKKHKFIKIIKITAGNKNCFSLDNLLKRHSTMYKYPYCRVNNGGGTEFYECTDPNILITWLNSLGAKPIDVTLEYDDNRIKTELKKYIKKNKVSITSYDKTECDRIVEKCAKINMYINEINLMLRDYQKEAINVFDTKLSNTFFSGYI